MQMKCQLLGVVWLDQVVIGALAQGPHPLPCLMTIQKQKDRDCTGPGIVAQLRQYVEGQVRGAGGHDNCIGEFLDRSLGHAVKSFVKLHQETFNPKAIRSENSGYRVVVYD